MNASKENCDRAIEECNGIREYLDGNRTSRIDWDFLVQFLAAARAKLPYERSFPVGTRRKATDGADGK